MLTELHSTSYYTSYIFFLLIILRPSFLFFFFFNDTATTEIYTLSLHDALPISDAHQFRIPSRSRPTCCRYHRRDSRSEEHTSELQSQSNLVCRLLLEKKKKKANHTL